MQRTKAAKEKNYIDFISFLNHHYKNPTKLSRNLCQEKEFLQQTTYAAIRLKNIFKKYSIFAHFLLRKLSCSRFFSLE